MTAAYAHEALALGSLTEVANVGFVVLPFWMCFP